MRILRKRMVFNFYSFRYGINETGTYKIDPDGQLIGNDPITVRCIFNEGEEAITEFGHDKVRMLKKC